MRTLLLLFCSNIFMTCAWYGQLKWKIFEGKSLWLVILMSWGIAFFEYCFQVPANRWGSAVYSPFQLKVLQEIVTLVVFVGFAYLYFGERLRWTHVATCVCLVAAVAFAFLPEG